MTNLLKVWIFLCVATLTNVVLFGRADAAAVIGALAGTALYAFLELRWRPWTTITVRGSLYMTRVYLSPEVRGRRLFLHWFHRGDQDPDPHDHPWDFSTFPLWPIGGYMEMRLDGEGHLRRRLVPGWRWTRNPATHAHLVVGPVRRCSEVIWPPRYHELVNFPLVTLVLRSRQRRDWFFWTTGQDGRRHTVAVPWEQYVATVQREDDR